MQCAINITLRRVRLTIVAVEKEINLTCSERVACYSACKARALYYIVIFGLSVSTLSHKQRDFLETLST